MSNDNSGRGGGLFVAGGLLFVMAVVLAIGAQYYLGRGSDPASGPANPPGGATAAPAVAAPVTAFVGGEKMSFLKDPRVVTILKDRYGITVEAAKAGSLEMVQTAMPGKDVLWPSTAAAVDLFAAHGGTWVAKENLFSSPLVVDSFDTVAAGLQTAGMVSERGGTRYLDMGRLVAAMEAGKTWKDLGMTSTTRVKVFCTDPVKSSSGLMFAGLLVNVLNHNEPPDEAAVESLLPSLKAYFARLGNMDASSADLFAKFLSMGAGAYPLVVAYENQLVEFVDANPQYRDDIKAHVVVLYPEPTIWSEHPMLALTANGKRLLDALQEDAELKKLGTEAHGFRSTLSGVTGTFAAIDATVPMPSEAVTARILGALSAP